MNQTTEIIADLDEATADIEAAADQLVDELCHRLTVVYRLLGMSLAEDGPAVRDIRERATALAHELHGPRSARTATAIARALWPRHPDIQVPASWWATPLGTLMSTTLPTHGPATSGATSDGAAERSDESSA